MQEHDMAEKKKTKKTVSAPKAKTKELKEKSAVVAQEKEKTAAIEEDINKAMAELDDVHLTELETSENQIEDLKVDFDVETKEEAVEEKPKKQGLFSHMFGFVWNGATFGD